jgi:hypothetical protein
MVGFGDEIGLRYCGRVLKIGSYVCINEGVIALAEKLLALPLFTRREEITGMAEIIKWWELRRIPFNIAVGVTGIFTCAVIFAVAAVASKTLGEPLGIPDPPILGVFAIIGYGIAANFCFTCGWLVEIAVKRIWQDKVGAFGEISFSLGLVFSVVLTLVPAAFFLTVLAICLIAR